MSRPLKHDTGPVVAVEIDGRTAAWCDGVFAGDLDMVREAEQAASEHRTFSLFRCDVIADAKTPFGAVVALSALNPGRAFVIECPQDVGDYFEEHASHV